MIKRVSGIIAAGAMVAGIAGCSLGGPEAPKSVKPDNSLEQVEHNLGYQQLSHMVLRQTIHIDLSSPGDPDKVNLYNFTATRVDPKKFGKLVTLYNNIASSDWTWKVPVNYNGQDMRLNTTVSENGDDEHDYVLVANNAPIPAIFGQDLQQGSAGAETKDFSGEGVSQTISVIWQQTDVMGNPEGFFDGSESDDIGLATEACQSLMTALPETAHVSTDSPEDLQNINTTTQENVCNTFGHAAVDAPTTMTYPIYKLESLHGGDVSDGGQTIDVETFPLTQSQYGQMHHALAG